MRQKGTAMQSVYQITNLLILRGVSSNDLFSKVETTLSDVELAKSEIPKRFEGVASWPKSSELLCWTCSRKLLSYPRFMPTSPEWNNGHLSCIPKGNFDTWPCVVSYMEITVPREQQWSAMRLICLAEAEFTGVERQRIPPAIDKTLLIAYRGSPGMSATKFNQEMESLG